VQRARRSSVDGEIEYGFKHVLVRDVAYGQIPRAQRAEKHLRAAEWIESLGRPEDHAETVAHHYVNALELTRAAGRPDDELAERTVSALREAGERALTLNALPQAENYYRQALGLAPDDPQLLLQYGRVLYLENEQGEAELTQARKGLLAAGDREAAAEASLMLADIAWKEGRRDEMQAYLDEAQAIVTDLPGSRAQAAVLTEVARYHMLANRHDEAVEVGRQALAMAEQLGFDALRVRAMGTIGVARVDIGDPEGLAQVHESIELASSLNAISEVLRGHNNLQVLYILHGEFERARAAEAETLRLARHYGQHGSVRFIEAGSAVAHRYFAGEWDDALARAEKVIAESEQGARFYQMGGIYAFRGVVRLARGDDEGAEADAERSVELVRPLGDPQAVNPDLAMAAFILISVGNRQRADETVTEALESLRPLRHLGFAVMESPSLAWTALMLGREAELVAEFEREPFKSSWLRAAVAVASRDFRTPAEIFGRMGLKSHEAFFRLQEGSEANVLAALDFYRSVGATRYVREAEEALQARVS
jgi:tetratricopeptide (TPR) repeat protein